MRAGTPKPASEAACRHLVTTLVDPETIKSMGLTAAQVNALKENTLVIQAVRLELAVPVQAAIRRHLPMPPALVAAHDSGAVGVTRGALLVRLKEARVWIWDNDPDKANFDMPNDRPLEIRRVLTPDEVDEIFASFGGILPWGRNKAQQEAYFGRPIMTRISHLCPHDLSQ